MNEKTYFFFQAEDGIRDGHVTGVQTCALPIWRTSITEAREMGVTKVLQGNLDPTILLTDWETIETRTKAILDEGIKSGGHVFNLGHGVTPDIKPETLKQLTALIHSYSKR